MRHFFNGLILGVILGAAGYWFIEKKAQEHPEAQQRATDAAAQAQASAGEMGHHLSDAFKAKLETLDLRSGQIKDELARTGKIVRRKAQDVGEKVADAAADASIIAAIKAKYAADPDLSIWKISVSSDQGRVTLSGTVSAEENIGKAVALALEADGVRDVTSTLAVKPNP
ncbi:MAG: BON domain-containing protein [Verrucomicrobiota bacterium]|jgi:osmotically-inducible protein OsmY